MRGDLLLGRPRHRHRPEEGEGFLRPGAAPAGEFGNDGGIALVLGHQGAPHEAGIVLRIEPLIDGTGPVDQRDLDPVRRQLGRAGGLADGAQFGRNVCQVQPAAVDMFAVPGIVDPEPVLEGPDDLRGAEFPLAVVGVGVEEDGPLDMRTALLHQRLVLRQLLAAAHDGGVDFAPEAALAVEQGLEVGQEAALVARQVRGRQDAVDIRAQLLDAGPVDEHAVAGVLGGLFPCLVDAFELTVHGERRIDDGLADEQAVRFGIHVADFDGVFGLAGAVEQHMGGAVPVGVSAEIPERVGRHAEQQGVALAELGRAVALRSVGHAGDAVHGGPFCGVQAGALPVDAMEHQRRLRVPGALMVELLRMRCACSSPKRAPPTMRGAGPRAEVSALRRSRARLRRSMSHSPAFWVSGRSSMRLPVRPFREVLFGMVREFAHVFRCRLPSAEALGVLALGDRALDAGGEFARQLPEDAGEAREQLLPVFPGDMVDRRGCFQMAEGVADQLPVGRAELLFPPSNGVRGFGAVEMLRAQAVALLELAAHVDAHGLREGGGRAGHQVEAAGPDPRGAR